jgi:hypothetical protein
LTTQSESVPLVEATRLAIGSPEIFIGSVSTSLKAVARALNPGGSQVTYNLSPAPNAAGKPYRTMADGRCAFSARDLAAADFETLLGDGVEDKAGRALGAALGWDKPLGNMKREDDLFALVTLTRTKPSAGRG